MFKAKLRCIAVTGQGVVTKNEFVNSLTNGCKQMSVKVWLQELVCL